MGGQRVENVGLAQTQVILGTPQQGHPATPVHHRIHFTSRQFLQALPGLVQRFN